jgi:three-Cys-motif partner protein
MSDPWYSPVDGLPVRESGAWAKDKLYYVGGYMSIFNGGMKNKWPLRAYIDLMAGPGVCADRETREEFDGSPVLALDSEPPFARLVFVDADPDNADALQQRTATEAARRIVLSEDCNSIATVESIRASIDPSMLTLCFVDNVGLTVTFDTIRRLVANGRPIDLLFTFQVNDLTRNVDSALGSDDGDRFDAFFGSPDWRGVIAKFDQGERTRGDRATALTDFYGQQLKQLGYDHFEGLHRVMKNTKNAPLYRLLIASRHSRAIDFFRKIAAIEHDGQRGFKFER